MRQILLVEDSEDSSSLIRRALDSDVEIDWATTCGAAEKFILSKVYDLILMDIVLPDGNGLDFIARNQFSQKIKFTPIIFITSKSEVNDKVAGFSVGADDYITKPFNLIELRARLTAKLKRTDLLKNSHELRQIGPLQVNLSSHNVYIDRDTSKERVDLTPIEYKILTFLMSRPGHVFSRDEILDQIWGKGIYVYPRSVDTHVSKLRKKLGGLSNIIESVHGTGYKIIDFI